MRPAQAIHTEVLFSPSISPNPHPPSNDSTHFPRGARLNNSEHREATPVISLMGRSGINKLTQEKPLEKACHGYGQSAIWGAGGLKALYAGVGRRGGYSFYLRNSTKAGPGDPSFRGSTPRSRSVSVAAPLHSCHEDGSSSNPPPPQQELSGAAGHGHAPCASCSAKGAGVREEGGVGGITAVGKRAACQNRINSKSKTNLSKV